MNYKLAQDDAENVGDNVLKAMSYGFQSGIDQFGRGVSNWFQDEATPVSTMEYGSAMVRENMADSGAKLPEFLGGNSLGQVAYDLSYTAGNMAPSALLGALTGGAGAAAMGVSAGGNATMEAMRQGYSKEQAMKYGALVGASEGALQYLLGGISKLGGKFTGNVASRAIQNIDSALLRVAANSGIKMAGEGTEEYLQEILEPIYRNLIFGENNQIDLADPNAVYSFMLGALTSGVMESQNTVRDLAGAVQTETLKARERAANPNINGALVGSNPLVQDSGTDTVNTPTAQQTTANTGVATASTNQLDRIDYDVIKRNKNEVSEMNPVTEMDGSEFSKGAVGIFDQVAEFFNSIGNKVTNSILGDVVIDRRGVKDSVSHGLGRNKAIAFKAVPDVIQNGKIIDYQKNWKGRGYDTVVLAAPVTIKGEPYYEGVVLIRPQDNQRFYLHEVLASNGKDTHAPFKTGTTTSGTSGDAGMPSLISLLNELRNVNTQPKNTNAQQDIPTQTAPRVNHHAESVNQSAQVDTVRNESAQQNPKTEQTAVRGEQAGIQPDANAAPLIPDTNRMEADRDGREISDRLQDYKKRHERNFIARLSETFNIPKAAQADLIPMLSEIGDSVIRSGELSQEDSDMLFEAVYDSAREYDSKSEYQDFKKYLHDSAVRPDSIPKEYRKEARKFLNLRNDGKSITQLYEDISKEFQGFLDDSVTSPEDM